MKLMFTLSLRARMTLLTGLIIFATSLGLTLISMYNARTQFVSVKLLENTFAAIELTDDEAISYQKEIHLTPIEAQEIPATQITLRAVPAPMLEAQKQFDIKSYAYLLAVTAIGMAAAYVVSGRALRPVHQLSVAILRISGQNLEERLPDSGTTDEIGSLTRSFNAMLERLEESFQRQKRFSANVAHELKTPLATMNAGIQVLSLDEQPTTAECLETLEIASRNVKRLMGVVDDLLALTNECPEEYSDVIPLAELFEGILAELSPLYAEKRLQTICDIQLPSLTGNKLLTQRMFFNLVENAMKYSREGGVITIHAQNDEITVSDNGVGIPETDLCNIFEPFYRVDSSRSRKVGGAGLGLSIVKAIAEKHGWTVAAKSSPGACTVMTVNISP